MKQQDQEFRLDARGTRAQVIDAIIEAYQVPEPVRAFALSGVMSYDEDEKIDLTLHGRKRSLSGNHHISMMVKSYVEG